MLQHVRTCGSLHQPRNHLHELLQRWLVFRDVNTDRTPQVPVVAGVVQQIAESLADRRQILRDINSVSPASRLSAALNLA